MAFDNRPYFEQPQVWSEHAEDYQLQVADDLADMLPPDVETVLDVGTGNGLIVRTISARARCFGADQSFQALHGNLLPSAQCLAGQLPFADGAFDLVMTTDMLEHVEDLAATLAELVRVSRRYVLVTVPFREDLSGNLTWCSSCRRNFHINHHLRRFGADSIWDLEAQIGQLLEIRLSGGIGRPRAGPVSEIGHRLGAYISWDGSRCPDCGSAGDAGAVPAICRDTLNALRVQALWHQICEDGVADDRTEVMCLFDVSAPHTMAPAGTPRTAESAGPVEAGPLLQIDFRRDPPAPALTVGRQVPVYRRLEPAPDSGLYTLELFWPKALDAGDVLDIELGAPADLTVHGISGPLGAEVECAAIGLDDPAVVRFRFDQLVPATQFGGLVRAQVSDPDALLRVTLLPDGADGPHIERRMLSAGANTFSVVADGCRYSWSLGVEHGQRVPDPLPHLRALMRERHEPGDATPARSDSGLSPQLVANWLALTFGLVDGLNQRVVSVSSTANDLEVQRTRLEDRLRASDAQLEQVDVLNELANRLEASREQLEAIIRTKDEALRELEDANRLLNERLRED